MDNKIIIQLIKREINELTLLIDALENTTAPQDILIDVTTSKVETLSEVVSFLHKDTSKTSSPSNDQLDLDKKSEKDIIKSLVEQKNELEKDETLKNQAETEEKEPTHIHNDLSDQTEEHEEVHTPAPQPVNIHDKAEEEQTATTPTQFEETTAKNDMTKNEKESVNQEKTIEPEVKKETYANDPEPNGEINNSTKNDEAANPDENNKAYKKVLGDQFTKGTSLNEKFTSLTEKKYKVMGKPVTSVKKAIGLNDRFMFTRELFNNDSSKFNNTVEAIDNANDLVEAVEYLEKNCEWPKNETSLKFMELVKRRFNN